MDKWSSVDTIRQDAVVDDVIPEHAFTIYEYMERYGIGRNTALSQLRTLVQRGRLKKGYKVVPEQRNQRVAFHWIPERPE